MTLNYKQSQERVLEFTARFGFVTRSIFFEFLCPLKRSSQYSIWAKLLSEGLIQASKSYSEIFYLTKKGRSIYGKPACPARSIYFIEHDSLAAQMLLTLKQSGLVLNYWTERDLRINPTLAYSVLGTDRLSKIPDLVVDLKSIQGTLKVAIEIERSQKTSVRYNQIAFAYVGATRIGLLIFACENQSTIAAIEQAFHGEYFEKAAKIPATLLLGDFQQQNVLAPVRFMNRTLNFKRLILAALKRPEADWVNSVDKTWKVVHVLSNKSAVAA